MSEEKEISAIKEHCLNPAMFDRVDVLLGTRGGFNLENKYTRKSHPLVRFFNQGRISGNQKQAGMRLSELAHISGIYAPSAAMSLDRVDGKSNRCMTQKQIDSYHEYLDCMKEIVRQCNSETQQAVMRVSVYEENLTALDMLPWRGRIKRIADGLQVAHEFLTEG